MRASKVYHLACTLVAAALAGCASDARVMSDSFETLTNESTKEGSLYATYTGVLSINGLAPAQVPGMLFYQPAGAGPSRAIGISPKWSFYTESTLDMPPGTEFDTVAKKYVELQDKAATVAAVQAKLAKVQVLLGEANARKPDDPARTTFLSALGAVLGKLCPDSCTTAAIESGISDMRSEEERALGALRSARQDFEGLANAQNIIVTHWTSQDTRDAGTSVGTIVEASGTNARQKTGVALFGGLRVLTMHFGEDFVDLVRNYKGLPGRWFFSDVGVVSYVVLAKRVRYFSDADLQTEFQLKLSGTVGALSELGEVSKLLAALDKELLSVNYSEKFLASLGNSGRLADAKVKRHTYCFYPGAAHQAHIEQAMNDELEKGDDHYSAIYAVSANVRVPLQWWLAGKSTDLSTIVRLHDQRPVPETPEHANRRLAHYAAFLEEWQKRCGEGLASKEPTIWRGLYWPFREDAPAPDSAPPPASKQQRPPSGAHNEGGTR